jgi:cytochrome P450
LWKRSFFVFPGGADTVVSALNTFVLAMTCYPDVQREAHKELDRVVTPGQLPDFEDEASLPYISAIVKELIRCVVLRR